MAKKDRVGKRFVSNEGYEFVIVEYNGAKDVWVEFQDEYKARIHTSYQRCREGVAKNPYHPSVCGKGYLGLLSDGSKPRTTDEDGKLTREYELWKAMIRRVYDHEKYPTYVGTILEDCLHCFAYFLEFVIRDIPNYEYWLTHPYERVALDKDIRGKGSKVYSRDTLIFIPQSENSKERIERCGFCRQPVKLYGINIKTGERTKVFESISEVERELGVNQSHIGKCLNGEYGYKTAGGYTWYKVE